MLPLEIVSLFDSLDDDDELRLAWHAGYVPNLPPAPLGHGSDPARRDHRDLHGGSAPRRHAGRLFVRPFRTPPCNGRRTRQCDRVGAAVGLRPVSDVAGRRSFPDPVHGAGSVGHHSRSPLGIVARLGTRIPSRIRLPVWRASGRIGRLRGGDSRPAYELCKRHGSDRTCGVHAGGGGGSFGAREERHSVRFRRIKEELTLTQPSNPTIAAEISARLDRLPATRHIWKLVLLLSLGGCFEVYDLFFTAYIGPGLVRSGLFSSSSASFFGFNGLASFVAATFAGLFIGTMLFGFAADWFGRRMVFTCSLLWYTAATVVMAFQHTALGIVTWRLIAGIGIGVELVTIDTYLTELVPKHLRGRAFAVLLTCSNNWMSMAFHAYQPELFPTRIRAQAVGFVYSWSRLSAIFTSFLIGFFLRDFGVAGVFTFIAASMLVVILSIGIWGPKTRGLALEDISH